MCVELQDGDLPLELSGTTFPGHYDTLELTFSHNLTHVPANAVGGPVTFNHIVFATHATLASIDQHFLTPSQRQGLVRITIHNCLALTSFPWQVLLVRAPEYIISTTTY